MNKLFTKIAGLTLGLTLAVGVGIGVTSGNKIDETKATAANVSISERAGTLSWENGKAYTSWTDSSGLFTFTAIGGGNNGKYYTADGGTWRMYSGGSLEITCSTSYVISAISSNPTVSFSKSTDQKYTASFSGTTKLTSFSITYSNATTPDFSLDKEKVSLVVGGESTTVTATPNAHVSAEATYTWTKTSGDDCVTLSNENTATVTIAPKGSAILASCTLTIDVTGCSSKTVSVTVRKVSSKDSPFTVAQAIEIIDTEVTEYRSNVYVKGIVSKIDSFNSGKITYWISDDGITTDQFEVYNGKGLNNVNFTSIADLNIGDTVTVFGNITLYNKTVYEFNIGNYLAKLERASEFSVSTSTSGLTLSTSTIGTSGSVVLTTDSKKKGTNVEVTGTCTSSLSKNVVTLTDVESNITIDATIVDAVIASLKLEGQTTKYNVGDTFSFDGTVTGVYDDWISTHTEEAIPTGYTVDDSEVDMSTEGVYPVTVEYNSVSESYNISVSKVFDKSLGEYHEVTSLDQLYDGAHITITNNDTATYAMKNGYTSENNVTAEEIIKDSASSTIATASKSKVLDIELVFTAENTYRLKVGADAYLYAASSSSNYLKTASLATVGDNGKFLFSLGTELTIVGQGANTHNSIRYNNTSKLFSCYSSGQNKISVYVFETYQVEANKYAENFNAANVCGTTDDTPAIASVWAEQKTAWGKLTSGAQSLLTNGTATGSAVEECLERYDTAVAKAIVRGTSESIDNFMNRSVSAGSASIFSTMNSDNNIIIIVVISVVSLTALGGYFFIRRRKETH